MLSLRLEQLQSLSVSTTQSCSKLPAGWVTAQTSRVPSGAFPLHLPPSYRVTHQGCPKTSLMGAAQPLVPANRLKCTWGPYLEFRRSGVPIRRWPIQPQESYKEIDFFPVFRNIFIICGLRNNACKVHQKTSFCVTALLHECHGYKVMGGSVGSGSKCPGLEMQLCVCAWLLAVCNLTQVSNQDIVIFISYLLWVVNQII